MKLYFVNGGNFPLLLADEEDKNLSSFVGLYRRQNQPNEKE